VLPQQQQERNRKELRMTKIECFHSLAHHGLQTLGVNNTAWLTFFLYFLLLGVKGDTDLLLLSFWQILILSSDYVMQA
jgi:hypothetical protein